jgi:predicted transcriptional regulator of viral defense system
LGKASALPFLFCISSVLKEVLMENQDLLTVQELATKLKVQPSWVYGETRKTGKGCIPRLRVGKYLRFSLMEVLNWLREQQQKEAKL